MSLDVIRAEFWPLVHIPVQSPKLYSHTEHPSHSYPVPGEKAQILLWGRSEKRLPGRDWPTMWPVVALVKFGDYHRRALIKRRG